MKIIEGRISSGFGTRKHPVTGKEKFHNGIDIACPIGTEVHAPAAGTVMRVIKSRIGGLQLIIRIENGERFGFAHLSTVAVEEGQDFKGGEVLAETGNSGAFTTGPHCHFTHKVNGTWKGALYQGGEWIDPTPVWKKEI